MPGRRPAAARPAGRRRAGAAGEGLGGGTKTFPTLFRHCSNGVGLGRFRRCFDIVSTKMNQFCKIFSKQGSHGLDME